MILKFSVLQAQQSYPYLTLEDRRNAVFGASRSKMFDPSPGWQSDRGTVNTRAGEKEGKMLTMLSEQSQSNTLENIRNRGMQMFLTTGSMQAVMNLKEQSSDEVVSSLNEEDITALNNQVNSGTVPAVNGETGIYRPRIALPKNDEIASRVDLQSGLSPNRIQALSARLNKKLGISSPDFVPVEPSVIVSTEGNVAVLRGVVTTEEDKKIAEIFLGFEPGVDRIRNELQVLNP